MTAENKEQGEHESEANCSEVADQGEPDISNTTSTTYALEIADTSEPDIKRSSTVRTIMGDKKLCFMAGCCCAMLIYFLVVFSLIILFVVMVGEHESNCGSELEQMKSNCLSNNNDLDYTINSSVSTEIVWCTILGETYEKCPMPKQTYALHELLSTERITSQVAHSTQCIMDNIWSIEQDDLWIKVPIGPYEVYRYQQGFITVIVTLEEGPLLGWVPLCRSTFVEQPLLLNFTVNSLDEFVLETVIKLPLLMAVLETKVKVDWLVDTWISVRCTASIPVELIARVASTDVRLQNPSRNRLTAVQLDTVSVSLDIKELGDIVNFTFTSDTCVDDVCDYVEDYLRGMFASELADLVVEYIETKFTEFEPEIEEATKAASYSEIDSAGLHALCIIADCHGMTVSDFVDKIVALFWVQIALLCILGTTMCYFCILFRRERATRSELKRMK